MIRRQEVEHEISESVGSFAHAAGDMLTVAVDHLDVTDPICVLDRVPERARRCWMMYRVTDHATEAHDYDFDLAVSFAGENRTEVDAFIRALDLPVKRVFYDEDYVAEIWGEDLVEYLADVYRRRARFVIMFVSRPLS